MAKLKLALYWAAGCGGCDMALLDINEKAIDVAALVEVVFWPLALDFKFHHVAAMPDKSIDICLFNGAIRNSEHERIALLLREKSKVVVAFGSCACFGGIPALANLASREEIFQRVYAEAPFNDNPGTVFPRTDTNVACDGALMLPEFYDAVMTLDQLVPVEYFMPGCPPPVRLILKVVDGLAGNRPPPRGTVMGSDKTLCDECERKKEGENILRFRRVHQMIPQPERCLLEQGIICCGPATMGGCGGRCISANMPCRGCFGPPAGVVDQGAKLVSAIASIYQGTAEEDIARMINDIADPAGTFLRFGLANLPLRHRRTQSKGRSLRKVS